jgi:hypothetical protein
MNALSRLSWRTVSIGLTAILGAGCASSGGGEPRPAAEMSRETSGVEFRSTSFTKNAQGNFVVVAQVRVRAREGLLTRDYYVKAGDAIGRSEADGNFRTGLTVIKIDKGERAIRKTIESPDGGKQDVTLLIQTYYLAARDEAGREQILWIAEGRGGGKVK